jgi:hypothetical protein
MVTAGPAGPRALGPEPAQVCWGHISALPPVRGAAMCVGPLRPAGKVGEALDRRRPRASVRTARSQRGQQHASQKPDSERQCGRFVGLRLDAALGITPL